MSELKDRKQKLLEAGAERVAGRLSARQRVEGLVDAGSFVEVGMLARAGKSAVGVVTGFGTVDGRPTYVYAQDAGIMGGAMDECQAEKIERIVGLAAKTGAPIVGILDSAGAKLTDGVKSLSAYAKVSAALAAVSGVVPSLSLVLGPVMGAASGIVGLTDIVIAAEKAGQMFMTGPQVVSARTGKDVSAEALGGAAALAKSGACHIAARDEEEAIAYARKLLSLLPANNEEDAPLSLEDDLNRQLDHGEYVDARDLLARIADFNDFMELQKEYAPNMTVGFGRLGGRTVGFVANNPGVEGGALCSAACRKASRFVSLCDCFNIPVVTLVATKGVVTAEAAKNAEAIKAAAQLLGSYAGATVPKISVICGDAIGSAYVAMGSKGLGADLVYAWPKAFIAPMEEDAAVSVLFGKEIREGADADALQGDYRLKYDGFNAAAEGIVDDVIEPASTRQMLAAALEMLLGKRESAPPRKHGNLPV